MPIPRLQCAIEQIMDWHTNLFVDPHIVSFVAVACQYSKLPALVDVHCENVLSRTLGKEQKFRFEISWH